MDAKCLCIRVLGQHNAQNQQRNNQNYNRDNGESAERDVCVFWWRGRCVKGKHCQWRHPLPTPGSAHYLLFPFVVEIETDYLLQWWSLESTLVCFLHTNCPTTVVDGALALRPFFAEAST